MNQTGFSLALFLICFIIAATVHLTQSSYNRECPCADGISCCFEMATSDIPLASGFLCENKCYCPFHKDGKPSCVDMNEKYKKTEKFIVGLCGIFVLVGLFSAILFYFEPWYDCACCCTEEEDDDDESIFGNNVIPRGITVKVLEERAAAKGMK